MDIIWLALDVIEKQTHNLKEKRKKGEKITFNDVKPFLKGIGALIDDKEILEEAGKKNRWYATGLRMASSAIKEIAK